MVNIASALNFFPKLNLNSYSFSTLPPFCNPYQYPSVVNDDASALIKLVGPIGCSSGRFPASGLRGQQCGIPDKIPNPNPKPQILKINPNPESKISKMNLKSHILKINPKSGAFSKMKI